jgi:hypothetical protein
VALKNLLSNPTTKALENYNIVGFILEKNNSSSFQLLPFLLMVDLLRGCESEKTIMFSNEKDKKRNLVNGNTTQKRCLNSKNL